MAKPRYIVPGQTHFITRRVANRLLRLRPSHETNAIIEYVLAVAASRSGVRIHAVLAMSNHLHLTVLDVQGRLPEFLRELHRGIAKAMNVAQGMTENLWSVEQTNAQIVADPGALVDRTAYLLANPVAAGLVESPEEWPGVCLWKPMRRVVKRPPFYFARRGTYPERVVLEIVEPVVPGWDSSVWRQQLKQATGARVMAARETMARARRKFAGAAAVMARSAKDWATSYEMPRARVPTVAATEKETLRIMLFVRDTFRAAYREALRAWRGGDRDVVFPHGTWWMVQHHRAVVAPAPAP